MDFIFPPRVAGRGGGTTRYEREVSGTPKLADDPYERKWVGPWLLGDTIGKGASGARSQFRLPPLLSCPFFIYFT